MNKRTVPPPVPTPRSGSLKLSQIAPAGSIPVTGTQFVAVTGGAVDNLYTIDQIAGFVGAGSGAPPFIGTSKHGLPTHSDVPVGYWMLIRDTLNNTTGLYYNDAGVLEVVYLSLAPLPVYAPTYYIYGF